MRKRRYRGAATASLVSVATLTFVACSDLPVQPAAGGPDVPSDPPLAAGEPPLTAGEPPAEADLVSADDPANAYLRAVGTLGATSCTGSFIKTSDDPDAPAYALTAGHCAKKTLQRSMYFDVGVDESPENDMRFRFKFFQGVPVAEYAYSSVTRVAYVTMKGADLALLQLEHTVGELQALGVEPLPLADAPPAAGEPIEIAGIPQEHDGGEYMDKYVRRARCAEGDRRADLMEHYWQWYGMHVNDCSGMGPGASGGAVLDQHGRVFGVYTTHFKTAEPQQPCHLNYPCEFGDGGPPRGVAGVSYVVDATGVASCFDAEGRFDLTTAGCALDPGGHGSLSKTPSLLATTTRGAPPEPSVWDVHLSPSSDTHYRYKAGRAESVDCRSADGYSDPIAIEDDRLAKLPVPAEEGLYALCVLTGSGDVGGATWQSTEHPTVVLKKVLEAARVESGPDAGDVTVEEAFLLASQAVNAYLDHTEDHQARFSVEYGAEDLTKLAIEADRTWRVLLGFDLIRQGRTPPDIAALIACHELGHALGGFPFKKTRDQRAQVQGLANGEFGTVSSTEGQADYFATKECLPRLWSSEREVNARFRETATEYAKTRCDAAWDDVDEQNLCYRLAASAEDFGRWRGKDPVPALSTPDTTEVTGTEEENPSVQCRVDTMFQGALCQTKFRGTAIPGLIPPYEQVLTLSPEVEAAAAPDSCTEGPGSRPRCWFAPNETAFDCTGIPELGKCDEIDGRPAVVQCSPERGIETFLCAPGSTCELEADGFALCVE
ncbi:trypsin-like serine peptidase [Sorangium sp. So ce233]|uniref:trypsin-like serine peptidase n=1 Tax=Sorangium sp. So ce233 TaxID=3133290 RepID=UPI003F5DAC50